MTRYVTVTEHRPSPYYASGWIETWAKDDNGKLVCVGQCPEGRQRPIGTRIQL